MDEYKLESLPYTKLSNDTSENEICMQKEIEVQGFYIHTLQNISNAFDGGNFAFLCEELNSICGYLSDKKIPEIIPFFDQFQIPEIIKNIVNSQQEKMNIRVLDSNFHLMFILTQQKQNCQILQVDDLLNFLGFIEIYTESKWYFALLTNYFIHEVPFDDFKANLINININKIQTIEKFLPPLKFLEQVSKFKFMSSHSEEFNKALAQEILFIVNYCSTIFHTDINVPPNNPVIESISIILERLTRKKLLNNNAFKCLDIYLFVRKAYPNYPKFIKMIGLYFINYEPYDADFLMIANLTFDHQADLNKLKYNLVALCNLLMNDGKNIYERYQKDDGIDITLCLFYIIDYLLQSLSYLQFATKNQAILLISLILRFVRYDEIIVNSDSEKIIGASLDVFMAFSEDDDEDSIFMKNVFYSMQTIYNYLLMSKSDNLIMLFLDCKEILSQIYVKSNKDFYQVLQKMTFVSEF